MQMITAFSRRNRQPVVDFSTFSPMTGAEAAADFTTSLGFQGIGAGIGALALGGIPGAVAGFAIGTGLEWGANLFSERYQEMRGMAEGLREIADQSNLPITGAESRRLASSIQDRVYSFDGRYEGLEMNQVQSNLLGFANAGGFNQVRGPEEMERVAMGVVENAQRFADTFNVAQDQAVQILANLEQNLITTTSQAEGFASRVSSAGERMGLNPLEALQFGLQGVDLVSGTGVAPSAGFDIMLGSRQQAMNMFRSTDPLTRNILQSAGGIDGAAMSMAATSLNYMQSSQGMMNIGAMLGGYTATPGMDGSMSGMLTGFANYVGNDPANLLGLPIVGPMVAANMSLPQMQSTMVGNYVDMLQQMGVTNAQGQVDEAVLMGMMVTQGGLSPQDAMLAVQSIRSGISNPYITEGQDLFNMLNTNRGIGERFGSGARAVVGEVGDFFRTDAIGEGINSTKSFLTDVFQNVADAFTGNERFRYRQNGRGVQTLLETENLRERVLGDATPEELGELRAYNMRIEAQNFLSEFEANNPDYGYVTESLTGDRNAIAVFSEFAYRGSSGQKREIALGMSRLLSSGEYTPVQLQTSLDYKRMQNRALQADKGNVVQINRDIESLEEDEISKIASRKTLIGMFDETSQYLFGKNFGDLSVLEQNRAVRTAREVAPETYKNIDDSTDFLNLVTSESEKMAGDLEKIFSHESNRAREEADELLTSLKPETVRNNLGMIQNLPDLMSHDRIREQIETGNYSNVEELAEYFKGSESAVSYITRNGMAYDRAIRLNNEAAAFDEMANIEQYTSRISSDLRVTLGPFASEEIIEKAQTGLRANLMAGLKSGDDFIANFRGLSSEERNIQVATMLSEIRTGSTKEWAEQFAANINRLGDSISTNSAISGMINRDDVTGQDIDRLFFNSNNTMENVARKLDFVIRGGKLNVSIDGISDDAKKALRGD